MKGLILVIVIFIVCAVIGYQVAIRLDPQIGGDPIGIATSTPTFSADHQHNLVIIHVDRLANQQPRLVSAWFLSFYNQDGASLTLTIAQMYPTRKNSGLAKAFERSFSLDAKGDPSAAFWKTIRSLNIQWEGYLLIDNEAVQKMMEWTDGPGNFPVLVGYTQDHPNESRQALLQTCQSIPGINERGPAPFELSDIMPDHFRSDLRMEKALGYWNSISRAGQSIKCEVVIAN